MVITKMPLGVVVWLLLLPGLRAAAEGGVNLWPMPKSVSSGSQKLYVSRDLPLVFDRSGDEDGDAYKILKEGVKRTVRVIHGDHEVDGDTPDSGVISGVHIVVASPNTTLNYGVDESYKLSIPAMGSPIYAYIEAQTVFGALHALQTFSQLCYFDLNSRIIEIHSAPWVITDEPRFAYRGLLIDTSRHYLPIPVIKNVIDSMIYTKLNVLHWHIVDTQSFPIEIPSYPKLWNGAYSYSERYTTEDAHEIVRYAGRRGINVLAEIDVPGHAGSWGVGYPSLWPSSDCREPLDVSNNFAFKVIDGILSDFSKIFKFKFVHLGGDEVETSCWNSTPHVRQWLDKHGMNATDAYEYFVLRAQKIALSHGYEVINWEETFDTFGNKLSRKTVVHTWLRGETAAKASAAGLRCIVSYQRFWYLDHLDSTWKDFYLYEPLENITNSEQQKLVIGGEVCLWGERIDASDIEQTIWPRAAAAAERLWTPIDKLGKDLEVVAGRLAHFRCLLNQRGVAASPLDQPPRGVPPEPGSCYKQ